MIAKPIRIVVDDSPHHDGSAPTVEDLLDQVRDFVHLLRAVEGDDHRKVKLQWYLTSAVKQSPLSLELTPSTTAENADVNQLASSAVCAVSSAINQIVTTGTQPEQMADATFNRINRIVARVKNGLTAFKVDFSKYSKAKSINIDGKMATTYENCKERLQDSFSAPRWEEGSMEGYTVGIATNQHGKTILKIRSRHQGDIVDCIDSGNGLKNIENMTMREIVDGKRILVEGYLHYKNLGDVDRIRVEDVYVYPPNSELPDLANLPTTNITNGLDSVEYIRRLRNGTLHSK